MAAPSTRVVDLNSDLGESFGTWRLGDDETMLGIVTSANVACGFHAGDPTTIRRSCATSVANGVVIGAQVGYRDLPGFGRRFIDVAHEDLVADVLYQLGALDGLARAAGDRVRYVKPHGALYNAIVTHTAQAAAVVEAVTVYAGATGEALPVLGLPGSEWLRLAGESGLVTHREAFADRAYTAEGTLVSRREPGAVLSDADEVADRVLRLVTEGVVTAVDGSDVAVEADSVCVHGDSPGAVRMARAVRERLTGAGVGLRALA
ncbi:5-oxoprolinase subunit PxpA [uncultured Nocardioides sp.]|uniref:LamB/YcsF family protein n=1 Tax=uncultured Nocardioides sp. TaxID=198441 RepID=UPI00261E97F1|nr:5-oxoprolinase subunit PxpA [uncultured Nocardioides sp.]